MRMEKFELENSESLKIRGDLRIPDGKSRCPVVILCHGFKGFKDWGHLPYLAEHIAGSGFVVASFNFSCSGIGDDPVELTELNLFARNTVSLMLEDLYRVVTAVFERTVPGAERFDIYKIGLMGHSLGGSVALLAATRDSRVKAVVTHGALSRFDGLYDASILPKWRDQGYWEFLNTRTLQKLKLNYTYVRDLETHGDEYDLMEGMSDLITPCLLIHGSEDESVPVEESGRLHKVNMHDAKLQIIDGAGHTYGAVHPFAGSTEWLDEVLSLTADFLVGHLKGK
jgi:pimeloyl-ACP methyl ester carboxylesterase